MLPDGSKAYTVATETDQVLPLDRIADAVDERLRAAGGGEAARRRSEAAAWRDRLVAGTRADASYFERLLPHYLRQPGVVGPSPPRNMLLRFPARSIE